MLDHLSASQAGLYLDCGQAWVYRYVEKIKSPINGPMLRGSALDEACNLHYRGKARGHGLERGEFVEAAIASHESRLENEDVRLDVSPGDSKDTLVKAAVAYYRDVADKLEPRSLEDVQRKWSAQLDGVQVIGYTDLITNADVVIDTKLKERMPSQRDVDGDLQLSTYAWLTGLSRLALAVTNPKTGKASFVWTERSAQDVERVQLLYSRIIACIAAGVAVPAKPTHWLCGPTYCDYWERCDFGARR
jgi:hypothetical protein